MFYLNKDGAPRENRTPTSLRTVDFESTASTNSTTGALYVARSFKLLRCHFDADVRLVHVASHSSYQS